MRKGLIQFVAIGFVVVIAAILSVAFMAHFKVRITNAIIYQHKADNIGKSFNVLLSLNDGKYHNSESMGSYLLLKENENTPVEIQNFDSYFEDTIYKIYPKTRSNICISFLPRDSKNLRIDSFYINNPCLRNPNLIQAVSPIALPYNKNENVKIVSLVVNK